MYNFFIFQLDQRKMKLDQAILHHLKTCPQVRQIEEIVHTDPCPLYVKYKTAVSYKNPVF